MYFNIVKAVLSANLHLGNQFRYYLYPVKRLILILLISIYTSATFGIGVRSFYCCNKLKSTTFVFKPTSTEKCNGKQATGKCCQTKYQLFKVKDTHVVSGDITSPVKHFTDLQLYIPSFQITAFAELQINAPYYSNAPSLHNGLPLYIFHCVYRVWYYFPLACIQAFLTWPVRIPFYI